MVSFPYITDIFTFNGIFTVEAFRVTTLDGLKDAFPFNTKSSRSIVLPFGVLIGIDKTDGNRRYDSVFPTAD